MTAPLWGWHGRVYNTCVLLNLVTSTEAGPAVPGGTSPRPSRCDRAVSPHAHSACLPADPSIGHRQSEALPVLVNTPSLEVTTGMTPQPGARLCFLSYGCFEPVLGRILGSSGPGRWKRVSNKQQHRVGPMGPLRRARKEVSQRG